MDIHRWTLFSEILLQFSFVLLKISLRTFFLHTLLCITLVTSPQSLLHSFKNWPNMHPIRILKEGFKIVHGIIMYIIILSTSPVAKKECAARDVFTKCFNEVPRSNPLLSKVLAFSRASTREVLILLASFFASFFFCSRLPIY